MELEMVLGYPWEALLTGSLSRLHISSKSPPRILDDRNVLDGARDSVRILKMSL